MPNNTIIGAFGFPQTGQKFNPRLFEKEYEKAILSTRSTEPEWKQKKSFSPSTLVYGKGTCPRYWHIAFTGALFTETYDSQGISNMDYGIESHVRIQTVMKNMGVLKQDEFKVVNENPPVFGYGDVLIDWEGEDVVGEIKTVGEASFIWRQTTGKPAIYHLVQLLIYMKILGLREGFIFYENRLDKKVVVVPVSNTEANKEIVREVFGWMQAVYDNWNSGGEIPTRPFRKNNKICQECPVFETCWNKLGDGLPLTIKVDDEEKVVGKLPMEDFKKK